MENMVVYIVFIQANNFKLQTQVYEYSILIIIDQSGSCRFERPPITEPKDWWHKMPVAHKNVYKRIPLDHVGAENAVSEHTIARAHDRAAPLQLRMFYSNNYGKRSFAATDTKVRWTGTG